MGLEHLREKYRKLSDKNSTYTSNLHEELKKLKRSLNAQDEPSLNEIEDYKQAKEDYLRQKAISQVYGKMSSDLGDGDNFLPDT